MATCDVPSSLIHCLAPSQTPFAPIKLRLFAVQPRKHPDQSLALNSGAVIFRALFFSFYFIPILFIAKPSYVAQDVNSKANRAMWSLQLKTPP